MRGLARCLFADSLLPLPPFFSLFLLHIIQAPCAFFFGFFSLYPCKSRTRYLSHTSRLLHVVSLIHHYTNEDQFAPRKRTFILLDSLLPKNLHYNLLIHLFKACFTPHENMHWIPSEFCLFFVSLT